MDTQSTENQTGKNRGVESDFIVRKFTLEDSDAAADVIATAFTKFDPATIAQKVSHSEFAALIRLISPKMARESLSVVSVDRRSNKIVGVILATDLAEIKKDIVSPWLIFSNPQILFRSLKISRKFEPIWELLQRLQKGYLAHLDHVGTVLEKNDHLYMFIGAVSLEFQSRGVFKTLIQACEDGARERGFTKAVLEATSNRSQRTFSELGYQRFGSIEFRTFSHRGKYPFVGIESLRGVDYFTTTLE